MEAHPANPPAPTEHRAGLRLPGVGTGIGGGMVMLYLSIIVLLPLAAVGSEAFSLGLGHFWEQVTSPLAKKSLELTVICSLIVVVINGFFGTILAWLLVRDKFPTPAGLFTIEELGGWEKANTMFDLETGGSIAKLEESTGIPTED